jgi:uncharacterized protein YabN with tetrapyrrole methylase and pyrophosphatase domain
MKQFLIDLTDIKANPMSLELQYEVGDIISMEVNCDIFGRYIVQKKVVKITENKYHKYRFIFVEQLHEEDVFFEGSFEAMVKTEIDRLMENQNA